jgi:hypothetical protein
MSKSNNVQNACNENWDLGYQSGLGPQLRGLLRDAIRRIEMVPVTRLTAY